MGFRLVHKDISVDQLLHRQQTRRVAENMRGDLSPAFFTLADIDCHLALSPIPVW